jgi:hypothetical protein
MTSTDIQIMSRLFEFLSSYKPEELVSAAKSPLVTAHVREALSALAKARAETQTETSTPVVREPSNGGSRVLKVLEGEFYAALNDGQLAPTAADIARVVARVGIHVTAGSKDGRSRIVGRVRRELDRLPPKEREQKYKLLLRELRPNQTEGWFNVIRGKS